MLDPTPATSHLHQLRHCRGHRRRRRRHPRWHRRRRHRRRRHRRDRRKCRRRWFDISMPDMFLFIFATFFFVFIVLLFLWSFLLFVCSASFCLVSRFFPMSQTKLPHDSQRCASLSIRHVVEAERHSRAPFVTSPSHDCVYHRSHCLVAFRLRPPSTGCAPGRLVEEVIPCAL